MNDSRKQIPAGARTQPTRAAASSGTRTDGDAITNSNTSPVTNQPKPFASPLSVHPLRQRLLEEVEGTPPATRRDGDAAKTPARCLSPVFSPESSGLVSGFDPHAGFDFNGHRLYPAQRSRVMFVGDGYTSPNQAHS
eukprot:116076-Pyramimonas_sp.AAC.1